MICRQSKGAKKKKKNPKKVWNKLLIMVKVDPESTRSNAENNPGRATPPLHPCCGPASYPV